MSSELKNASTTQNEPPTQNGSATTQDETIHPECHPKAAKSLKRKGMQQRSTGWDHFVKYTAKDGSNRARCKYCPNKTFACDTTTNLTSNILKHSKACPNNPDYATKQSLLNIQSNATIRFELIMVQ